MPSPRPGTCNSPATLWSRARRVGWPESIRMRAALSGVGIWEGPSTRGRRRAASYGQLSARRHPIGSSRSSPTMDKWPPAWSSIPSAPPESPPSATSSGSQRPAARPSCCSVSQRSAPSPRGRQIDPADVTREQPRRHPSCWSWSARFPGGLRLVGATGFEPATFRPPAECATKLRHAPFEGHDIVPECEASA